MIKKKSILFLLLFFGSYFLFVEPLLVKATKTIYHSSFPFKNEISNLRLFKEQPEIYKKLFSPPDNNLTIFQKEIIKTMGFKEK